LARRLRGRFGGGLSHLVWGLNLPIYAVVYGFGMCAFRSWPELAAMLGMLGVTFLYGAIYVIVPLDAPGVGVTLGLIALAMTPFVVYMVATVVHVNRLRTRLGERGRRGAPQHWKEPYFARLRARRGLQQEPVAAVPPVSGLDSGALFPIAFIEIPAAPYRLSVAFRARRPPRQPDERRVALAVPRPLGSTSPHLRNI
jgi:hypothetical protein